MSWPVCVILFILFELCCAYIMLCLGLLIHVFPHHVCKLSNALYGLKQAPRAWFQRLSTFLLSSGFVYSRTDPSLFIYARDLYILYLLMYVYDLILTGNQEFIIFKFTIRLNHEFAIKDLEDLFFS